MVGSLRCHRPDAAAPDLPDADGRRHEGQDGQDAEGGERRVQVRVAGPEQDPARREEQLEGVQVVAAGLHHQDQGAEAQEVRPGARQHLRPPGGHQDAPVEHVGHHHQHEDGAQRDQEPGVEHVVEGEAEDVEPGVLPEDRVRDVERLGVQEAEDRLPLAAGLQGGQEAEDECPGQEQPAKERLDHQPAGQAERVLQLDQDVAAARSGGQPDIQVRQEGKGQARQRAERNLGPEDRGEDGGQLHLPEPEVVGVEREDLPDQVQGDEHEQDGTDEVSGNHAALLAPAGQCGLIS